MQRTAHSHQCPDLEGQGSCNSRKEKSLIIGMLRFDMQLSLMGVSFVAIPKLYFFQFYAMSLIFSWNKFGFSRICRHWIFCIFALSLIAVA
jgi:hypothetical protein